MVDVNAQPKLSLNESLEWLNNNINNNYIVCKELEYGSLPSYDDQNIFCYLKDKNTQNIEKVVLKISNNETKEDELIFENSVMSFLKNEGVPQLYLFNNNHTISKINGYYVRLVSYLPGELLENARPFSDRMLNNFGEFLGRIDKSMSSYEHPLQKQRNDHPWNLDNAVKTIETHYEYIELASTNKLLPSLNKGDHLSLIKSIVKYYKENINLSELRKGVMQNDANDQNVLVDLENENVNGLIDFGDTCEAAMISNVAIACSYMMLSSDTTCKNQPILVLKKIMNGYFKHNILHDNELRALIPLSAMRMCVSVSVSALQACKNPQNSHAQIMTAERWELVSDLAENLSFNWWQ